MGYIGPQEEDMEHKRSVSGNKVPRNEETAEKYKCMEFILSEPQRMYFYVAIAR